MILYIREWWSLVLLTRMRFAPSSSMFSSVSCEMSSTSVILLFTKKSFLSLCRWFMFSIFFIRLNDKSNNLKTMDHKHTLTFMTQCRQILQSSLQYIYPTNVPFSTKQDRSADIMCTTDTADFSYITVNLSEILKTTFKSATVPWWHQRDQTTNSITGCYFFATGQILFLWG